MSGVRLALVLALLLLAALPRAGAAAGEDRPRLREASKAVLDEALSTCRTHALLADLCRTAPRRLSGSPAAAAAVEWARQTMREAGLENVRLEPVTVPHWVRGDVETLRFVAPPRAISDPLPILALGGSVSTPKGGITAEVIAVRSFAELERRAEEAKGRIVLFDRPMDPTALDPFRAYGEAVPQRVAGASEAAKVGAAAALVRSVTPNVDDVPHTGGMRYSEGAPPIPAAAVSTRGAERISRLLEAGETVRLHLELSCRTLPDEPSANVIGELRGTEKPEEIVLVGAHLDSWDVGEGAHDDGAGCCQAIEALAILGRLGLRPRRTLRAVLFMNEENGLAGGRAYAEEHAEELARHVLALESDRGGFAPRGFTSDAGEEALAVLRRIVTVLDEVGAGRIVPGGGGADISPLARSGVVLAGFLPDPQRYFDVHHARTDAIGTLSPREVSLGTACIAILAHAVADLPEPLPRNPPPESR